jgi:hypothetical protein
LQHNLFCDECNIQLVLLYSKKQLEIDTEAVQNSEFYNKLSYEQKTGIILRKQTIENILKSKIMTNDGITKPEGTESILYCPQCNRSYEEESYHKPLAKPTGVISDDLESIEEMQEKMGNDDYINGGNDSGGVYTYDDFAQFQDFNSLRKSDKESKISQENTIRNLIMNGGYDSTIVKNYNDIKIRRGEKPMRTKFALSEEQENPYYNKGVAIPFVKRNIDAIEKKGNKVLSIS